VVGNCRKRIGLMLFAAWTAAAAGADGPWHWSGSFPKEAVQVLLVGDINVQKRADPAEVFNHVRETLNHADLVYGNLEGLLVKSEGPDKDIPDKSGWQHIGPEAVRALNAGNIKVVGVANNVAYGPENVIESLAVLDADHIAHTGGGANLDQAHKPAIVERKGVKFGFLQYTAKWYLEDHQIATATRAGVARMLSRDGVTVDPADLNRMREDIRHLRPLVDIVVVSSHNRDGLAGRPTAGPSAEHRATRPEDLVSPIILGTRFSEAEPYERELAHAAIEAGADIVYGHGSHVLQGVEVYQGKPVVYCVGNFAMDWIRMRPNKEGLAIRVVAARHKVFRVSLVPLTRDGDNEVVMLDPSTGEGERLVQKVKGLSKAVPLTIDDQEIVLVGQRMFSARN
jgi:poly-gamma-glutamate capsule biosynthesis protein CapA/YwtB (metallophosphatase superfamily)